MSVRSVSTAALRWMGLLCAGEIRFFEKISNIFFRLKRMLKKSYHRLFLRVGGSADRYLGQSPGEISSHEVF